MPRPPSQVEQTALPQAVWPAALSAVRSSADVATHEEGEAQQEERKPVRAIRATSACFRDSGVVSGQTNYAVGSASIDSGVKFHLITTRSSTIPYDEKQDLGQQRRNLVNGGGRGCGRRGCVCTECRQSRRNSAHHRGVQQRGLVARDGEAVDAQSCLATKHIGVQR